MDEQLISSRVRDAVRICDNSSFPKFVGFLRAEETQIACSTVRSINCNHLFYGGYEDAERVYLGVFPDWCKEPLDYFPITALTFKYRAGDKLSHRNFLGTFMSLGITRESVGDILIEAGRAVAFFSEEIAEYVIGQITKVSNVGVTITKGFTLPLPGMSGFEEITNTISSPRLDCVVSSLMKCSRGKAADIIEAKLVSLNGVCLDKTVKNVQNGDKITIKGTGKFVIESIDGKTKKDRLIINAKKYI